MSATNSSASGGTGGGELESLDSTSPLSPSSPHLPYGRRRRAAAFSYSRVRDARPAVTRLAKKASATSLVLSGGSAEVPAAVANGTNGHLTHSSSEDGTSSTSNTNTSSSVGSEAAESEERRGGEEIDAGVLGYEFVEAIPSECRCGLCGKLVEDPQQTQCCKTDYCKPCISTPPPPPSVPQERTLLRWKTKPSGLVCPVCKTPNLKLKTNEELRKRVAALQVKCLYAGAGCVWEGEREWLKEHLERDGGCVYVLVVCSNCGMELRKKDEWNHATSECSMRIVHCQYCEKEDTYDVITNHYKECPHYPTTCPANCGETLPTNQLQYHLDYSCVAKGLKCPFRAFGCTEGLLSPEKMAAHVTSCGALHLGDMARKVTTDMDKMQREIRELRSENEALRREVKSTAAAMATTNEALSSLQSRSDRLSHTLVCEMEYYCHASEPHELVALECMKTQLASRQIHLHAGGSPAVVRMTSYIRHKESGQVWLSPPFCVCSGYKLRLAVHLNGVGAGKGSHVSVFLHQMAGEMDNELHWPFLLKDRVRVSLIDQTKTLPNSPTHPPPPTTPRSSPTFLRRESNLPPLSPPSPVTLSLPPTAAPLRQPRRLADDQRPPPLRQGSALVVIETQTMAVQGFLRRVRGEEMSLGGVVVSKMELFCTQSKVNGVVHLDSLVFSFSLCSGNLSDGHIAC